MNWGKPQKFHHVSSCQCQDASSGHKECEWWTCSVLVWVNWGLHWRSWDAFHFGYCQFIVATEETASKLFADILQMVHAQNSGHKGLHWQVLWSCVSSCNDTPGNSWLFVCWPTVISWSTVLITFITVNECLPACGPRTFGGRLIMRRGLRGFWKGSWEFT